MKPRFLPILLAVCPLVFNQSAAFAYDDNAQQQILQIQNQLEQQFPQQIQANQPRQNVVPLNQGQQFNQSADAQQQILQINQQLQQMTQVQQQQPMQMARPMQMQQMQQPQQMSQPSMMQTQMAQPSQNNGFAPSNSQSLNLPVLNSTISGYTSVTDVVPNQVGVTSGVDILDESLKFHSQSNGQMASTPVPQNASQNFTAGAVCNHATASGANNTQGCCQHAHGNANSTANNTGLNAPLNTRAIGAIGAAALVGTFLSNGGVGGMIKSVGWDNSRHTRGMSIGGY